VATDTAAMTEATARAAIVLDIGLLPINGDVQE